MRLTDKRSCNGLFDADCRKMEIISMGNKTNDYVSNRVNSVIGKGTEFEGTLRTKETLRIEGYVKGTVISEGTLIVGNGGLVEGRIEAVNIMIGGEVRGELYATGKVEANPTGRIFGDINTKNLIVDEKAVFEGHCVMMTHRPDVISGGNE